MIAVAVAAAACASPGVDEPVSRASGPPRIQPEIVSRHAAEIDGELPRRAPGSQEELAAATYIVAHLQQAGFRTTLDAVPVADLVRSTNVRTPHESARVLIAVVYDTAPRPAAAGGDIGLFLELARAAAVAGHDDVAFAALGAEHATQSGGHLGSRRMAQLLTESGHRLELAVVLTGIESGGDLILVGDPPAGLSTVDGDQAVGADAPSVPAAAAAILGKVADHHVALSGDPVAAGRILLEFLAS